MKAIKTVAFHYRPTAQTVELLQTFRTMVNDAIRICLKEGVKRRLIVRNRIYKEFKERYNVVSCFPYSVAEVAWSIVKKHRRWQRRPVARRLMLKMDSASYSLNYSVMSLSFKKEGTATHPTPIRRLPKDDSDGRDSHAWFGDDDQSTIFIAFSKEVKVASPLKRVGMVRR